MAALQSTSTSTSQPRPAHNSPEHPLMAMTQCPTSAYQLLTTARIDLLPFLASIFEQKTSTLQHVPKGTRDEWASIVRDVCSTIMVHPADMDGWVKLFMLPRCVLASPVRGGRTHWRNTVKLVRSRIRRWRAGDYCALWADMMEDEDMQARSSKKSKAIPLEQFRRANARWARLAAENGQYRKALLTVSSAGLADATSELVDAMLAKHPQSPSPLIPPSPIPPSPTIYETYILKALKSFPSGSTPGPSNLRANYLKEAVQCSSLDLSAHATLALTGVIQLLCAGHCPPDIIPHLCSATFLASKKGGGF